MIDIPQPDPCRACGSPTEYVVCRPDEDVPVCCDACSVKLGFRPPFAVASEPPAPTLAAQLAEAVDLLRMLRDPVGWSALNGMIDAFLARVDGATSEPQSPAPAPAPAEPPSR